jgi:hypothetical protein
MNNALKLIEFKPVNNNVFTFDKVKRLTNLNNVNAKNNQIILIQVESEIEIFYCHKYDILEGIKELNKYFYDYHGYDYFEFKLI